jgi:hypothetical protein
MSTNNFSSTRTLLFFCCSNALVGVALQLDSFDLGHGSSSPETYARENAEVVGVVRIKW